MQDAHLTNGNAAFFVGKVQPDLSVRALNSTNVGPGVGEFILYKLDKVSLANLLVRYVTL